MSADAIIIDDQKYDETSVQHLQDADHIRKRPDNYIPDRSTRGLHHLVYELVYNAVDEHLAGHCQHVYVTIHIDGSLSVGDDGRGIPVAMHPVLEDLDPRSGHDQGRHGGQVRQQGLQDLGRPARHGGQGRHRARAN